MGKSCLLWLGFLGNTAVHCTSHRTQDKRRPRSEETVLPHLQCRRRRQGLEPAGWMLPRLASPASGNLSDPFHSNRGMGKSCLPWLGFLGSTVVHCTSHRTQDKRRPRSEETVLPHLHCRRRRCRRQGLGLAAWKFHTAGSASRSSPADLPSNWGMGKSSCPRLRFVGSTVLPRTTHRATRGIRSAE